jgi:hypothetical protein
MSSRNHIQDELNGLQSNLPSDPGGAPYSVPAGYFEGLAASVLAKVRNSEAAEETAALSPLLAGISRQMPYSVPESFFQANIEHLPALVSGDQESLVLSFVEKEMPYSMPQGYFDALPEQVLEKVADRRAKLVPITRRKWMRLAVAAMIAGIIAVSGFLYFNRSGQMSVDNPQWVAKNLKGISSKGIEEFVKTAPVTSTSTATAQNKPARTADVKEMLQDVSDKELDAFLDQVPTENDEEDLMTN